MKKITEKEEKRIRTNPNRIKKIYNIIKIVAQTTRDAYVDRGRIFISVKENENTKDVEYYDILNYYKISNNFKTVFLNSDLIDKKGTTYKYVGEYPVSLEDAEKIAMLLTEYETRMNKISKEKKQSDSVPQSEENVNMSIPWINNTNILELEETNDLNLNPAKINNNDLNLNDTSVTLESLNAKLNFIVDRLYEIESKIDKTDSKLNSLPTVLNNLDEAISNMIKSLD